jgi:LPS export ABC transporter protein LptC
MIFKRSIALFLLFILFFIPILSAQAQDADQQINDFSLAGYDEKGRKTWDISGKSADIFEQIIELKDLVGNMYGKKEDMRLEARRGNFDKTNGKIHVEKNVVITTSQGAKLTTESLDWDRANQLITSGDLVNINKENMFTTATGVLGRPDLNQMTLEKDVTVEIQPQKAPNKDKLDAATDEKKIVITCDGPLEIDYAKNIATFKNNVKAEREDSQIYSDTLQIYFNTDNNNSSSSSNSPMLMGASINKIIATGNVKTVRGENITYSEEAIYSSLDKKLTFLGRPRLIIYSTKDFQGLFKEGQ